MQIKSTKDCSIDKLNILIYAPSSYGKTKSLGTLPGKTLIVSLESGLLSLKDKDIDVVEIEGKNGVEKLTNLRNLLGEIKESDYDNVCFDSLTEIAECFVDYAKHQFPDARQALPMWGSYKESFKNFIKYVRDMDKNIVYTCLDKTIRDEIGVKFSVPKVSGSLAEELPAFFDFVFTILIVKNEEEEEKRCFLTKAIGEYICKDRSGELDAYEKIDFTNIINKLKAV